ncbi:MAG: thiolase family protein [Chthoniobacter sp.]|uniref:thiolase family protein n=1 Tax=Chthoniobacter sp. TaxID=2510640 RepID=UPI0032A94D01
MNERMVIVDGVRTPFCKSGTELSAFSADDLGRIAVNALLTRTGLDPALIDEVIFGCVAQPMEAANIARVIALRAGIPESVPAVTVHRNCASGFEAFTTAYERMAAGRGSIYVVGGTESMSHVPLLFQEATARKFTDLAKSKSTAQKLSALTAFRVADFEPRAGLKLGLTDPVCGLNMGETAELLAREDGITREQQDAFALQSHQRALAAEARLAEEMCPVFVGGKALLRDNGPRSDQSMAVLGNLRPVFEKYGTVTAGNSSQITDGAVALLLMTESRAKDLGFQPLGVLTAYAYAGCDPARMGLGPVAAIERLAKFSTLNLADADLVEINEAFAAQVLAVLARLKPGIPPDKLNVNGGAIALGHPVGATGARLVLSSLKELARRQAKRALVTLCVGGGQGGAIWLERI